MIDSIREHLLDLLQADDRLIRAGNAWGTAFGAAKRIDNGDTATADCVNIFDDPHDLDSDAARPAIYAGTKGNAGTDELDYQTCSSVRMEYRVFKLTLVIVATGSSKKQARQKRNQLRANVLYILLDHLIEEGYWYEMTAAQGRGSERQVLTASHTGGGSTGQYEAIAYIPVTIRYSMSAGGSTA